MQPQSRNHLLFFLAVTLLFGGYLAYQNYFVTPSTPDKPAEKEPQPEAKVGGELPFELSKATPDADLHALGSADPDSPFMLQVKLDPLGGGVRSVLLNKFRAADENGRPEKDKRLELVPGAENSDVPAFLFYHYALDEDQQKSLSARPLDLLGRVRWEIVPEETRTGKDDQQQQVTFRLPVKYRPLVQKRLEAVQTLRQSHLDKAQAKAAPLVLSHLLAGLIGASEPPGQLLAGLVGVATASRAADEALQEAQKLADSEEERYRRDYGLVITRKYTLAPGEYHVGHEVRVERAANDKSKDEIKFRYQLAGARGLPIEGKWYTATFRNAHVCWATPSGSADRKMQELRQISNWQGGDPVSAPDGDSFIRFASVAVQYFASAIVVDNEQEQGSDPKHQRFLTHATPTLERAVVKGKITSLNLKANRVVLSTGDSKEPKSETIYLSEDARAQAASLKGDEQIAAICRILPYDPALKDCPRLAVEIRTGDKVEATQPLWEDDLTVRVNTATVDLEAGKPLVHRYLLYHGPVKPSLLAYVGGKSEVDDKLVARYADTLSLNKMTDSPSEGWAGKVGRYTYFTDLIIFCTNVIHRVLGFLTSMGLHYGLCILILTVLVRGMMYPLSRRQAMMSIRMQELAPEIEKIKQKYADDQAARGQAVMELYRKRGVNPLGSCWVIFLQMPVFMGLWYALQESIQFRLAPFRPTWIENLAAPDMLLYWGRSIPWLTADASYGGFLYLGPYLNVLPIVAVSLMLVQQKLMTPPPADEQQEMQQKMMKYMMIVMCLMFYKVAAGLCVYFIASSLWGLAERKLLPKAKKPQDVPPAPEEPKAADLVAADRPPSQQVTTAPAITTGKKTGRNRKKERAAKAKEKEQPRTGLDKLRQQVADWWNDVLDQAKKK